MCTASSPTSIDFISYCDISYVREMSTAFPRVSSFRSLINFSRILREFLPNTILSRIISSGSLKEQYLTRSFRSVTNCSTVSDSACTLLAFRFHMIPNSLKIRLDLLFIIYSMYEVIHISTAVVHQSED